MRAAERALAEVGFELDLDTYLLDMSQGRGSWASARLAGVDEATIDRVRVRRDALYQRYLATEDIEVPGVEDVLADLSGLVRMAVVTTAKRTDVQLIHRDRRILPFMDFVLVREDYEHSKPHPEPYLTALERFGATPDEALVVEDSARGLAAAVAAGIACVVVHHDLMQGGYLAATTHRITSLAALGDLLRQHYLT